MNRRSVRWRYVVVALAGATALALAAIPFSIVWVPQIHAVTSPKNIATLSMVAVKNGGQSSGMVGAITGDSACTAAGITAMPTEALPFPLAPMQQKTVNINCPAIGEHTIKRCQFTAFDTATMPHGKLTVLCIVDGAETLQIMPPTPLDFGDVDIGQQATLSVFITSPSQYTKLAVHIGDQDGNFVVGDCNPDAPGCDITTGPTSTSTLQLRCTPQRTGPLTAQLYIVANTTMGAKLGPFTLDCNGTTGSGNQPEINANPPNITIMHGVTAGMTSQTTTISNSGPGDLVISAITKSGHADWTMSIDAGCAATGCTLPPTGSFVITAFFDPTAISTTLDGTINITSNDMDEGTLQITLDGTGLGATLAHNLGSPPMLDVGSAPIGSPTSNMFQIRNNPGNVPLPVMLTPSSSIFTVMPPAPTLSGGQTQDIVVTCTPNDPPRTITGTIDVVASSAVSGSPFSVGVQCVGTAGTLFATPSTISLGEVRTTSPPLVREIQLSTTSSPLTISAGPSLAHDIDMLVTPASPATLTSAVPAMFELSVDPMTTGMLVNTIAVSAMPGMNMIAIPISGQAVTPAIAVPAAIQLGSFCIGEDTRVTSAELVATGSATIRMASKPVLGKLASPFAIDYTAPIESAYTPFYDLPGGERAMVELRPNQQMTAGVVSDELVWTTDMPGMPSPRTALTAEFIADGGAIAPQLASFGQVAVGQAATTKTITIQNCGDEPMLLEPPRISPTGEFADASPEPLPAMLATHQTATLAIGFTPMYAGVRDATLTVGSSSGDLVVALTGEGVGSSLPVPDPASFYACDCGTSEPVGALALVLVVLVVVTPRRRRARS